VKRLRAFTLIELLVVIAIIALLLAVVIPSLNLAKKKAAAAVCLVNAKNLALGWYMYQEDNDGWIMSCEMNKTLSNGTHVGWVGTPRNAAGNLLDPYSSTPVTDEDEIRGIQWGALWPYVKASDAYNCPADNVKSIYDGGDKLVTYAIPYALNRYPEDAAEMQIRKYSELSLPSLRYVFVETAETRNFTVAGHWVFGAPEITGEDRWGWWGPLAVNHGESSILGFTDGHAENHKWRDSYTIERVEKLIEQGGGLYGITYPGDLPEFPIEMVTDLNYMAKGWPYRYRF
jgi:prepilin-type N-terminal cleavage/methylation domain-containing protein